MNRTVFSLPAESQYQTRGGLAVQRVVEHFSGHADRLDALIDLLDRRRGVVLSSGTTVPGTYEDIVRLVIPELQKRGLFRKEYAGSTLRENVGLARPRAGDWRRSA